MESEGKLQHEMILQNREKLTLTAVEDVESFDEGCVVVSTACGTVTVTGTDFRIHKLNIEDGQLVIEGTVDAMQYRDQHPSEGREGFWTRVFR